MAGKRTTVLVVEDDKAVRNALSVILENRGYDVLIAVDGEQALGKVTQADVILLDLRLPKIDGEEFLKRIRALGNYTPVVVMSAYMGRTEGLDKLKAYQIVDFIEKPFTLDYIGDTIRAGAQVAQDMKTIKDHTSRLKAFVERQTSAPMPMRLA